MLESDSMADLKYWIAFNRVPNLGTVKYRLLEANFDSLEHAWTAGAGELQGAGIDSKTARSIVTNRANISPDGEMEKIEQAGIRAINWHDPMYPPRLKEIHDPPPVLYVKGEILPEDERSVAVVGTRKASAYGREATSAITRDLARSGVTIISGLARGIDAIAHRSALDGGGRTIALFGCGLDIVYPSEHSMLAHDIEGNGALISEYPLGTKPKSQHFPIRNRIISGMTLGTLVIEAGERRGAQRRANHGNARP